MHRCIATARGGRLEGLVDGALGAESAAVDRHFAALLLFVPLTLEVVTCRPVALLDVGVVGDDAAEAAEYRHRAVLRVADGGLALVAHDDNTERLVLIVEAFGQDSQMDARSRGRIRAVAARDLDLFDLYAALQARRDFVRVRFAPEDRSEPDGDQEDHVDTDEAIVLVHDVF